MLFKIYNQISNIFKTKMCTCLDHQWISVPSTVETDSEQVHNTYLITKCHT